MGRSCTLLEVERCGRIYSQLLWLWYSLTFVPVMEVVRYGKFFMGMLLMSKGWWNEISGRSALPQITLSSEERRLGGFFFLASTPQHPMAVFAFWATVGVVGRSDRDIPTIVVSVSALPVSRLVNLVNLHSGSEPEFPLITLLRLVVWC